ncbi:MAG: DUF4962 domain-containing protein [Lentisphaeria bacterium]|nr:DUF4962 domain-containing protein [Lentisphaeria bacterium]
MKLRMAIGMALVCGALAAAPSFEEFAGRIRKDHPRLFLTKETLPVFRERANTACKPLLDDMKKRIDALPAEPKLEFKTDVAELRDGELVFKKLLSDQNAAIYAVETSGGTEALECAILYLATGDRTYFEKAKHYLRTLVEFVEWSDRCRTLPEWFNNTRLSGVIAYDWLYDELTPGERRDFIGPMLKHIEHMQNPGYMRNSGGAGTGNYGEPGLQFYAGLAACGDGIDDARAGKLLKAGYELNVAMMDLRDRISGGSGLLTSICTGYSFGEYPWASYNFLHALRSAAGIDGTKHWTQMRDYGNWFSWAAIPSREVKDGFLDFGWGDAFHQTNALASWMMYTHLAQAIHFYGESEPERVKQARAVMEMVPPHNRRILGLRRYPYLSFILTGFDPAAKNAEPPEEVLAGDIAAYFPTFGLMVVRSGATAGDTFASVKAGAQYSQHQHYDENSFTIYKKGFQALDTGIRGSAKHHRVYYPQSVAHNTVLIRMEGEPLPDYWYPRNAPAVTEKVFNDGGQNRMAAARPLGFEKSAYHAVTGGDATGCYSPAKCREAVRQFVYVAPDYFVIYDRVTSVKPDQKKSFLLHTQNGPQQLSPGLWRSEAGEGALFIRSLLPEKAAVEVIGGPGREFWTNGRNWEIPGHEAALSKPNWLGRYRLELSPPEESAKARFLTVLQAADKGARQMAGAQLLRDAEQDGVRFTTAEGRECEVRFNRDGLIGGHIAIRRDGKTLVDQPLLKPAPAKSSPADFARIDASVSGGKILLADKGDAVYWEQPRWFAQGKGGLVQFAAAPELREGSCKLKAEGGGTLTLLLRGPDIRKDGKRMVYYVEFPELSVNGKPLLTAPVRVWHDRPKTVTFPVEAGGELEIKAKYKTVPGGDRI